MPSITIYDNLGNEIDKLYQYDVNRVLVIQDWKYNELTPIIYYSNVAQTQSYKYESILENGVVKAPMPNIMLKSSNDIHIYVAVENNGEIETLYEAVLPIHRRAKPPSYIYTDDVEYITIEDLKEELQTSLDTVQTLQTNLTELITDVEQKLQNGDFEGEKGEDGFSPSVNLERVNDGVEITITDKSGDKTAKVFDGRGTSNLPYEIVNWETIDNTDFNIGGKLFFDNEEYTKNIEIWKTFLAGNDIQLNITGYDCKKAFIGESVDWNTDSFLFDGTITKGSMFIIYFKRSNSDLQIVLTIKNDCQSTKDTMGNINDVVISKSSNNVNYWQDVPIYIINSYFVAEEIYDLERRTYILYPSNPRDVLVGNFKEGFNLYLKRYNNKIIFQDIITGNIYSGTGLIYVYNNKTHFLYDAGIIFTPKKIDTENENCIIGQVEPMTSYYSLNGLLKSAVKQTTGQSISDVMSQKAVTDMLDGKQNVFTVGSGISIINNVISCDIADSEDFTDGTANKIVDASGFRTFFESFFEAFGALIDEYKQDKLTAGAGISIESNIISATLGVTFDLVQSLPQIGTPQTIYLVPNGESGTDIYDEYIWVNNAYEKIGSTDVDLSGYAQISDVPTKTSDLTNDSGFLTSHQSLAGYYTKSEVDIALAGKQASGDYATNTALTNGLAAKEAKWTRETVSGTTPTVTVADHKIFVCESLTGMTVTLPSGFTGQCQIVLTTASGFANPTFDSGFLYPNGEVPGIGANETWELNIFDNRMTYQKFEAVSSS